MEGLARADRAELRRRAEQDLKVCSDRDRPKVSPHPDDLGVVSIQGGQVNRLFAVLVGSVGFGAVSGG